MLELVGLADTGEPLSRTSSRAASSSGSRSGARSRPSPRSCCSTSRSRTSTPRCGPACAPRCATILTAAERDRGVRHPRPGRGAEPRRPGRGDGRGAGCCRSTRRARSTRGPVDAFVATLRRRRRRRCRASRDGTDGRRPPIGPLPVAARRAARSGRRRGAARERAAAARRRRHRRRARHRRTSATTSSSRSRSASPTAAASAPGSGSARVLVPGDRVAVAVVERRARVPRPQRPGMTGTQPSPVDVAVLGAGPAGLVAALALARPGRSVVVLERAPAPVASPAASRSRACASTTAATGCTAPARPRSWRRCATCSATTCSAGRGTAASGWRALGRVPAAAARPRAPPPAALRAARSRATPRSSPFRRPRADTFAEVVRARLGPTMADDFYDPYVEKIWGVDPTVLAGELARRRVERRARPSDLRAARAPARPGLRHLPLPAPRVRRDRRTPRRRGGRGRRRAPPRRRGSTAFTEDGRVRTDGPTVHARQVWSTIPASVLATLADPAPPAAVIDAAAVARVPRAGPLLPRARPRPVHAVRRALLPDAGRHREPGLGAEELPRRRRDRPGGPAPCSAPSCPCTPGRRDLGGRAERARAP